MVDVLGERIRDRITYVNHIRGNLSIFSPPPDGPDARAQMGKCHRRKAALYDGVLRSYAPHGCSMALYDAFPALAAFFRPEELTNHTEIFLRSPE